MAQINRTGTVIFSDASLHIWEEPKRTSTAQRNEWKKVFRKQVFKRIIQQLNRLGWTVAEWDEAEHYRPIAHDRRSCHKGDLKGHLGLRGSMSTFRVYGMTESKARQLARSLPPQEQRVNRGLRESSARAFRTAHGWWERGSIKRRL